MTGLSTDQGRLRIARGTGQVLPPAGPACARSRSVMATGVRTRTIPADLVGRETLELGVQQCTYESVLIVFSCAGARASGAVSRELAARRRLHPVRLTEALGRALGAAFCAAAVLTIRVGLSGYGPGVQYGFGCRW